MKALILGAGGQVGRALVKTVPPGTEVVALCHARCNILSREEVERAVHAAMPDLVINAAAFTAVDRAETEVAAATALNAVAPGIIARAARAAEARTVHISTDYVFDGAATSAYRPADPTNPKSVYGRTKLAGEVAVRQADPDALTVRTMWLHSGYGVNFVTKMVHLMRGPQELRIVSDQIGTPTHARSFAMALWSLAATGAKGIFHYRDSGTASWHGFAVAIQKQARALGLLDTEIAIIPVQTGTHPAAAPRPAYSVLDATDAWRIIGREPPHWRDTLQWTLEEMRARG